MKVRRDSYDLSVVCNHWEVSSANYEFNLKNGKMSRNYLLSYLLLEEIEEHQNKKLLMEQRSTDEHS